jgi:hypothetical protein
LAKSGDDCLPRVENSGHRMLAFAEIIRGRARQGKVLLVELIGS